MINLLVDVNTGDIISAGATEMTPGAGQLVRSLAGELPPNVVREWRFDLNSNTLVQRPEPKPQPQPDLGEALLEAIDVGRIALGPGQGKLDRLLADYRARSGG